MEVVKLLIYVPFLTDPFSLATNQANLVFMKEDRYAHQKGFRIILAIEAEIELPNRVKFELARLTH